MLHRIFSYLLFVGTALVLIMGSSADAQHGVIHKLDKEFEALDQAYTLLLTIKDEKSAEIVSEKISRIFNQIGPHYGNRSWAQVNKLAEKQDRINRIMFNLMKEELFEKAEMQVIWTLITDPESRKEAKRRFK